MGVLGRTVQKGSPTETGVTYAFDSKINCLWQKGGIHLAISRAKKEAIVAELREKFEKASIVVVTQSPGLTVGAADQLRARLREAGADYKVAKNSLVKLAAADTDVAILNDMLTGPNAFAIGYDDPVALAKALVEFRKENEVMQFKGAMLNGTLIDEAGIEALAKLPSREVLMAQMLSVLVATPTKLVQALSGIPRKLLYALRAIEDSKK